MPIRIKAFESYITLEKHIFPNCDNYPLGKQVKLTFKAIIDEDSAEGLEDSMAHVAGCEVANNRISDLRKSFKRSTKRKDANRNDNSYDETRVLTVVEFLEWPKLQVKISDQHVDVHPTQFASAPPTNKI